MYNLISAYCEKHNLTIEGFFSMAYAFKNGCITSPGFIHNEVEKFTKHEILPDYVEDFTIVHFTKEPPLVVIF